VALLNYSKTLVPGASENVADAQTMFEEARAAINALDNANLVAAAEIEGTKLAAAFLEKVGVNGSSATRRGKSIIVLPTDGLLLIGYKALWKSSVSGAGRAALFLDAVQLKESQEGGAPISHETVSADVRTFYGHLTTGPEGLVGRAATADSSDATTGQMLTPGVNQNGGLIAVFAAAGTYDVSVQFSATSGSVTAKQRKLWAVALGF
jgi:hypothetical protein